MGPGGYRIPQPGQRHRCDRNIREGVGGGQMSDSLRADAGGPRTVPEIWGRVPLRNKNFTGREEILQQLADSLMSTVTAVVDVSGTGVTRPDPGASQPRPLRSSLAALAPRLGLPPATATSIEDAAAAVLEALRRGRPYDRWLLIFDNADEPDDIREILPHGPRTGHVLITSRNHRWQNIVGSVPVNVFNRDESIKFLTKRVPSAASDPHVNRLAEELGDLPLALEQAAAVQAETGMSIQEYLRLFKDQTAKLLA